jgi:hypothetical protein
MNYAGVFAFRKMAPLCLAPLCLAPLYLAPLCLAVALAGFDAATVAQTQQAPVSGTRLVMLGTAGGPFPRNDRAQPSNLLAVDHPMVAPVTDAGRQHP